MTQTTKIMRQKMLLKVSHEIQHLSQFILDDKPIQKSITNKEDELELIDEDFTISKKVKDNYILSRKNYMQKPTPNVHKDMYLEDDDEPIDNDNIIIEMQSNLSEESKRHGSIKSNISKDAVYHNNSILKILNKLSSKNEDKIIEAMKVNLYALKTALMTPIDIFVESNPG